jgi:hypothetical protein
MARSEMRWEMGVSASEIASTAFSNPKIFRVRLALPPLGLCPQSSAISVNLFCMLKVKELSPGMGEFVLFFKPS